MTPASHELGCQAETRSGIQRAGMAVLIRLVARTTEQGSRTLVHAAKPDIDIETHGAFLMDCKIAAYVSELGAHGP